MKTKIKPFPKAPKLRHLIGPSFILVGLGLGSGEVILWPFLVANHGLGIIWAAVLGISFQFFLNMEIERYALVKGESVFVGFGKLWRALPYWFIFSTFVGFAWPGMAAAAALMVGKVFGLTEHTQYIAIGFLVLIGIFFTLGPVLYRAVEKFQKIIILTGVPLVFALAVIVATKADWAALYHGLAGVGNGYAFFPEGIVLAVFLSAFAYSGAGGNLNLSQSMYIKDKGYGMGKYAGRITSVITGKAHALVDVNSQVTFNKSPENIRRYKSWWRKVNIEHALVFWLMGAFGILMLALLAYATTYGQAGVFEGIQFVLFEGAAIGEKTFPFLGTLFLIAGGIMLFATQMVVFEGSARIISENIAIIRSKNNKSYNLSKIFYATLWFFIGSGIIVLLAGFTEPRALLVLGAVINAVAMMIHIALTFILNHKQLDKEFRPAWWRKIIILFEIAVFAAFSAIVLLDKI